MNPLLRIGTIGLGGITATIAIFFSSVIGPNYQGLILNHLADIVNGNNTTSIVSTNAPNWEVGLPMPSPVFSSVASSSNGSAASGLASSTPYTFEIAALDGSGTTTIFTSSTFTTDASNTQQYPEDIVLKWGAVNGAAGYAIYFGTTTTVPSTGLSQYFFATTSNQYTFSTSTGSLSGSYTKNDTTAFSEVLNPLGADIFNDNINISTSSKVASTTGLQVNGDAAIVSQATTTACEADTAGVIFFNLSNKRDWGCNGTTWTAIF